jgi:hypothetical protein
MKVNHLFLLEDERFVAAIDASTNEELMDAVVKAINKDNGFDVDLFDATDLDLEQLDVLLDNYEFTMVLPDGNHTYQLDPNPMYGKHYFKVDDTDGGHIGTIVIDSPENTEQFIEKLTKAFEQEHNCQVFNIENVDIQACLEGRVGVFSVSYGLDEFGYEEGDDLEVSDIEVSQTWLY